LAFGFRVQVAGCSVRLGFMVEGFGFRVCGLWFATPQAKTSEYKLMKAEGFRFRVEG